MPALDLTRVAREELAALTGFLSEADLTVSGLDAPSVRLWVERDGEDIVGSTGYELCGEHALIRSVAVREGGRRAGRGSALARFALDAAAAEGATRAWLFSRRSGPFWRVLGFTPADRDALAAVLADTQQVQLFARTGQLQREVAWSMRLTEAGSAAGEGRQDVDQIVGAEGGRVVEPGASDEHGAAGEDAAEPRML